MSSDHNPVVAVVKIKLNKVAQKRQEQIRYKQTQKQSCKTANEKWDTE